LDENLDLGIEGNRCEAVHEAINKFVVYEKFAEMTHKYDVQHFAKLLEDYNTADELKQIRSTIRLDDQLIQPKIEDENSDDILLTKNTTFE
jgi:hypothetical protein